MMRDHFNQQDRQRFAERTIRRKPLFLLFSLLGLTVGLGLGGWYLWQAVQQNDLRPGLHFVVVLLILLNARQNLRQYRYARLLEDLIDHPRAEKAGGT
jgi:hypothetical protein